MTWLKLWVAIAMALPMAAFAAAEGDTSTPEHFRAINPAIDSWTAGTVTKLDSKTGEITVHGKKLPYVTAHAQMRQELRQKLAGIDDKAQRRQIIVQVHKDWNDRLQAAMKQEPGEAADVVFKQPAEARVVVILDSSDVRDLPFFKRLAAARQQRMGTEAEAVEHALADMDESGRDQAQATSYSREKAAERREMRVEKAGEAREAIKDKAADVRDTLKEKSGAMTEEEKTAAKERAENARERMQDRSAAAREKAKDRIEAGREKLAGERLAFSDLKVGDKVLIGFDKDAGNYFSIIRCEVTTAAKPASHQMEPATAK
jgi:hypothetical protein